MAAFMHVPNPHHRKERQFRLKDDFSLNLSNEELRQRYRFGRDGILFLTDLVSNDVRRKTNRNHALTVPQQIMVTLRFLATGSFLQVVGDTIGLHKGTVSRFVSDILDSLCDKREQFIKWPGNLDAIRGEFYQLSGFPNVLGSIEGTHIRIQAPSENEPSFVNRKGVHSINMQAVCDAKGKFTNINANWPGSCHDAHIFRTSQVCHYLEQNGGWRNGVLIGDSGYPCRPFLMTPYQNPDQNHQKKFNKCHSSTRTVIERTFGRLNRRFRILHSEGLGNHEFDRGVDGLLPLLENANSNFTIMSCNIDASREPAMQNKFSKSVIKNIGDEWVGIIGYTTKYTPVISNPGNLIFLDEVESIRTQVQILSNQGVNKIIAVGHAGFNIDKKIAAEVSGIDVIVGGHTNTFLYTGTPPSNEKPVNVYPTVIQQTHGDQVLVVQDYAFGKYLGFLQVEFDNNGEIISYDGNPILLDNNIPKDAATQNITNEFGIAVDKMMSDVIGRTLVFLDGERTSCRKKECNMGNLIADGLVHQNLLHADSVDGTKVFIALVNSGSIKQSIEKGNITVGHALSTQPYRNTIETIRLRGDYLLQALERSVDEYDPVNPGGQFLQYSGIRVQYDLSKPPLQRVVKAYAICQNCTVPQYEFIDKRQKYGIILLNFILSGGDSYTMIKDNAELSHTVGDLDSDVLIEYVRNRSPIYQGLEGRIQFVTGSTEGCVNGAGSPNISYIYMVISLYILNI